MADYLKIPTAIAYDDNLPDKAKLLFGEISLLCNKNGYCWATNQYFAERFKITVRSVQILVKKLEECGYIFTVVNDEMNGKKGARHIHISPQNVPTHENNFTGEENFMGRGEENFTGGVKKTSPRILQDNNTRNRVVVDTIQLQSSNLKSIEQQEKNAATTTAIPQSVLDFYQQEIRPICNGYELERLTDDVDRYGADMVIKALQRAIVRGKRNLGYTESILADWEKNGYDDGEGKKDKKSDSQKSNIIKLPNGSYKMRNTI